MRRLVIRALVGLTLLGLATTPAHAQSPAPGEIPEDRPFTGDPGGEPPPPPMRPRRADPDPRATQPTRPGPDRPKPGQAPVVGDKDLLTPRGPNILSAGLGLAAGLTRHSTGGFELNLGWSYQMTRLVWFDVLGNLSYGGSCPAVATDTAGRVIDSDCGQFRGVGIDLLAGIQLKFVNVRLWKAPVVPFARAALGVSFIITDKSNDGAALVLRLGGGARYYFTPWFSVGGELALTLGPAFRNHLDTGFYTAISLLAGVEFLL